MSLVTCGSDLRDQVPYTENVNSLLWSSVVASSSTACESQCGGSSLLAPVSSLKLSQCGSCLKEKALADEKLQYGCHWCTTVMAPLHYSLSRVPEFSDVVKYLDEPHVEVDAAWSALSQCERGRQVASTCMLEESGLPYTAPDVPAPVNDSKSKRTPWEFIVGGVAVGILIIVVAIWFFRAKVPTKDLDEHIASKYPMGGAPLDKPDAQAIWVLGDKTEPLDDVDIVLS